MGEEEIRSPGSEGGEGEDFEEDQTRKDHQGPAAEGSPASQVGEDLVETRQVGQTSGQSPQHSVREYPPQMESSMMGEPLHPRRQGRVIPQSLSFAYVEGVGHDQGPAHPQAMEASQKTDQQRSKEIK